MNTLHFSALSLAFFLGLTGISQSADTLTKEETVDITQRISGPRVYVGIGADNLQERRDSSTSLYGAIEGASEVLHEPLGLRFRIGADVSDVGAWAGLGISTEYVFEENPFYIETSFLAGIYEDFDDLDLGHPLEFRSQIAVGYHFENNYDIAIGLSHKSNAGIGDTNSGAEALYIRLGKGL